MRSEDISRKIGELLKRSGATLSAAESCTGGEISHLITVIPGSSNYYLGSVTSYAISVKEKLLGVKDKVIEDFGVVSSEVAAAMAEGVRKAIGSTFAVSTTGLAGPGGDEFNPEGTVWIGISGPNGTKTLKFSSDKGREGNIEAFSNKALTELLDYISSSLNLPSE